MTTYERGNVILVPFPFSNQTTAKKRPAVIISSNAYNSTSSDIVIMAITLFSFLSIQAQKSFDLSSVNYTDMTDTQLELLFQQAASKGYNYNDILKAAKAQGLSAKEMATLDKRFNTVNTLRASKNSNVPNGKTRLRNNSDDKALQDSQLSASNKGDIQYLRKKKSDIFGFDVFKGNGLLTFQSNLNIPTPAGYILGPGDKLFIDIYGQSEAYYQPEIKIGRASCRERV